MVRQTTLEDLEEDLRKQLLTESNPNYRCPNLKINNKGAYCGRDFMEGEKVSSERRRICDNASLQLWCLDKDRYAICIWYKGEPFKD
jgi:hypothetical protein